MKPIRNTLEEIKQADPQSFDEFLPLYLEAHSHPINRLLHFLGTSAAFALVFVALWLDNLYILWLTPLAGYGPAWIGHFFIESNIPASYSNPFWSIRGDFRMYAMMIQKRSIMHFDK